MTDEPGASACATGRVRLTAAARVYRSCWQQLRVRTNLLSAFPHALSLLFVWLCVRNAGSPAFSRGGGGGGGGGGREAVSGSGQLAPDEFGAGDDLTPETQISSVAGRDRVSTAELMPLESIQSGMEWNAVVEEAEGMPRVSLSGVAEEAGSGAAGAESSTDDEDADFHDVQQ